MLADQVVTEGVVRLAVDQLEAGRLVDPAGRGEHVVGPERDRVAAGCTGVRDAGLDEGGAGAEAARVGGDEQDPEHGDRRVRR